MARDYSHGFVRKEKIRDFGSFRMRVNAKVKAITGWESGCFTDSEIREQMNAGATALDAAVALLYGTDYGCDEPEAAEHGRLSWIYEKGRRL
jgi:hypothetical protein